jgi:hypothetical protein
LRPCAPFNPGEVAGFDPAISDAMIARGDAELYLPDAPEPPPIVEPKPEPEMTHIGGGIYLVDGEQVKGKAQAARRLSELKG